MVLYQSKLQVRQLRTHMAYFITDENSTKGRDPNINIISGIHCIKGKTSVNILVSNYANNHIKFNKGEPAITDSISSDQPETHPTNSVTVVYSHVSIKTKYTDTTIDSS